MDHNLQGQEKPLREAGAGAHRLDSGCCQALLVAAAGPEGCGSTYAVWVEQQKQEPEPTASRASSPAAGA